MLPLWLQMCCIMSILRLETNACLHAKSHWAEVPTVTCQRNHSHLLIHCIWVNRVSLYFVHIIDTPWNILLAYVMPGGQWLMCNFGMKNLGELKVVFFCRAEMLSFFHDFINLVLNKLFSFATCASFVWKTSPSNSHFQLGNLSLII